MFIVNQIGKICFFTDQRIGKNIIFLINNGTKYNDYETFVYVRDLSKKDLYFSLI